MAQDETHIDDIQKQIDELRAQKAAIVEREKTDSAFWNGLNTRRLIDSLRKLDVDAGDKDWVEFLSEGVLPDEEEVSAENSWVKAFVTYLLAPTGRPIEVDTLDRIEEGDLTAVEVLRGAIGDDAPEDLASFAVGDVLGAIPEMGARRVEKLLGKVVVPSDSEDVITAGDEIGLLTSEQVEAIAAVLKSR